MFLKSKMYSHEMSHKIFEVNKKHRRKFYGELHVAIILKLKINFLSLAFQNSSSGLDTIKQVFTEIQLKIFII